MARYYLGSVGLSHQRVAQALQSEFPATADTEPEILAHHYTQAGLTEPAITYWKRAGQRAAKSSAYAEAIGHCSKGLELIAALPEMGSLDNPEDVPPKEHYGIESQVLWLTIDDGLPRKRTEDDPRFQELVTAAEKRRK